MISLFFTDLLKLRCFTRYFTRYFMCYCNTRVLGYIRAFVADVKNAFLMLQDVLRRYAMFHWKLRVDLALFLNNNLPLFFDFKQFLCVKTDIYISFYKRWFRLIISSVCDNRSKCDMIVAIKRSAELPDYMPYSVVTIAVYLIKLL